ncbi:MAG: molybdopterin-dependent oxidoreductase [Coriobacteriales bacterium]|jgi:anaerobic dimethyl sulfoxide reductase subunit A|nr:molybdopterin-dependent oxidoreductase [Coriobacteriales bacterium]
MAGLLEKIEKSSIDRRKFVGLAATAGVVASLGLTGCDNKVTETTPESPTTQTLTGGKWVTFLCPQYGCSWCCVNQAYVVDGIIKRQRTDETIADNIDNPQVRSCIKGRSTRRSVTQADRLKYPMKRKSWQPGGGENTHGELRGIDEWERISWDEAITYIADEFKRIMDTYGPRAFVTTGQDERKVNGSKIGSGILNALGGCLTTFGQQSQGGCPVPSKFMVGHWDSAGTDAADRMAMRHTKLILFWGFNPAWSQGTSTIYDLLNIKKISGAKVICIDPWFNPTAQALADQWIPLHPSTDGALLEALAHEMITNNLQDQDFLDRCTVGFDADHMPADAKTDENFKDYILGAYDGQPKTAEWASSICGIPVETIKQLARDMTSIKPMVMRAQRAPFRTYYGNRNTQLFFAIGWMAGSVGILGSDIGIRDGTFGDKNGKCPIDVGDSSYEFPENPICTEPRGGGELTGGKYDPSHEYGIAFSEWHRAIVTGEYTIPGPANEKRACDIKCIYCENARNSSNAQSGNSWAVEAYRKVEFVVHQELYMKFGPIYSDIVLPVKSLTELDYAYAGRANSEACLMGMAAIPPYYESKDDVEIYTLLADKLGLTEEQLPRTTAKQTMFEIFANTTVANDDGNEYEPLLGITQEDIDQIGVKAETQEGRVSFQEFAENGYYYRFMRSPNDNHMNVYLEDFRKDPEANQIENTTSGKLEIYCQALKDFYDRCQLHDIDPLPKYKPMVDGYEQSLEDPEFPFQMVSEHHLRQLHSTYSNDKEINEVFPNDLMMSEYDANRLGFESGDWVLASSREAGKIARRLQVMSNLIPGAVYLGEGNWKTIDPETGIDIGGNTNTVTRAQLLGDGYQAYNTVLLKIEKYTGKELLPDYKRPLYIPIEG